jgi:hypothetical protein
VTRIPKIFALLAFLTAAGCRDSYPSVVPPLNILYFPIGMTVRQMPPDPAVEARKYGWSQLVVLNSNFDLRYDEKTGGSLLVIDPDQSGESTVGGPLAVLGAARIASFGGEIAMADGSCQPGWPDCPSACSTIALDPEIAAGGAKLVFASRSSQLIYRMSMAKDGSLACNGTCTYSLPISVLDPYGVSTVCSDRSGIPVAHAYVSHLMSANNLGYLSRMSLVEDGTGLQPLVLGSDSTYTSVFDRINDRLFVSSSVSINPQFRWFNPLVTASDVDGFLVPDYAGTVFSSFLTGAVARDMAISKDGARLYVSVLLYDLTLAIQTGILYTQGGAVASFDLTPNALGEPTMALRGLARTCLGAGQIRRLPVRDGAPDLFAVSCDVEGALAIFDSESHTVVQYIGHDPRSGLPVLGRFPFGLAVEPIDPRRATVQPPGSTYPPSPCIGQLACTRIYVGSFLDNWVNVLELDPDRPSQTALVKRIGSGP